MIKNYHREQMPYVETLKKKIVSKKKKNHSLIPYDSDSNAISMSKL